MSWYRCYLRWRHGTRRLPRPLLGFLAFGCVAAVVTLARIGALSQQASMGQRKYELVQAASRNEQEPARSVRLAESAPRPVRSVVRDGRDRSAPLQKDSGGHGEDAKYRARQKPLHPPADGRKKDREAKRDIEPEAKSGKVSKVLPPSGDISNSNIAGAAVDVALDRLVIRGVRPEVLSLYRQPDFTCLRSGEVMPRSRINDDYCDCADGTDEPGTAACSNGIFHCRGRDLPSSRVGDGVCDCCDGSDELGSGKPVFWLPETVQRVLGRYQAPCGNTCR